MLGTAGLGLPAAAAAQTAAGAPHVIDGPSPDILSLGGMSIARDGTGGLVYLKNVGGVAHVFVSRLLRSFQTAVQVDASLPGPSSQPVIAAGNDGLLLVAFVNGGELYVTEAASPAAGWAAPQPLAAGAEDPAIAISNFGKAYLAFTAAAGGGEDVRAEYFNGATWAPASGPLNVTPGDDAGTGTSPPAVAAAGDGVGIVAWGEGGHVYARRVWGTAPSVDYEQLDPATFAGEPEASASNPEISVGGDSSYADIAFEEAFSSSGQTETRVLMTRLIAEDAEPAVEIDGLGPAAGTDAVQPAIAMNEYGRGFATAATEPDGELVSTELGTNGAPSSTVVVDPDAGTAPAYAVPALAGLTSRLIVWQQTLASGSADIAVCFAGNAPALGPTQIISNPAGGPTEAHDGLAAGGDNEGDAAAAWVQGTPGQLSIDATQMLVNPGQAAPSAKLVYTRQTAPRLSWSAAREEWGPLIYTVDLDGSPIGQTTGTSLTVPDGLIDGTHVWSVSATNAAGLTSTSPSATVVVDTTPPRLRFVLTGRDRIHGTLRLRLVDADAPNPTEPGAGSSGVAKVTVRWGDGTAAETAASIKRATHAYTRAGLYRLTATVTDRAGNTTTISRFVRILS